MTAGGQQGFEGRAEYAAGAADEEVERPGAAAGVQAQVVCQGGVAVGKHPRQLGLDPLVHPPGQEAVAGQGVVDLVLESGAVRGVGEAVGVGPAGKGAAQLHVPEKDTGLGGQVTRVPAVGHGAGVELQNHLAAGFDGAGAGEDRRPLPGRHQPLQGPRPAVPVVEGAGRAGEGRGSDEAGVSHA